LCPPLRSISPVSLFETIFRPPPFEHFSFAVSKTPRFFFCLRHAFVASSHWLPPFFCGWFFFFHQPPFACPFFVFAFLLSCPAPSLNEHQFSGHLFFLGFLWFLFSFFCFMPQHALGPLFPSPPPPLVTGSPAFFPSPP